jgi:hypothetical protein
MRHKIPIPDVPRLVKRHIVAGERIELSRRRGPEHLDICLIVDDQDVKSTHEQIRKESCGRMLSFAFKNGNWNFIGEGVWRSSPVA